MKLVNKITEITTIIGEENSALNVVGYIYEFNEREIEYLKTKGVAKSKKYYLISSPISDDLYNKKYTKMLDEIIKSLDIKKGIYSLHETVLEAYYYALYKIEKNKFDMLVKYYIQNTKDFVRFAIKGRCDICIEKSEDLFLLPVNARDKMGKL